MRTAKDNWFQHEALESKRGRHDGKLVWKCIHDIQRVSRSLMPMRSAVVRDKDGVTCTTTEAQNERWRRRFSKILNEFDLEELGRVKQRPLRPDLAGFPTEEELGEPLNR